MMAGIASKDRIATDEDITHISKLYAKLGLLITSNTYGKIEKTTT